MSKAGRTSGYSLILLLFFALFMGSVVQVRGEGASPIVEVHREVEVIEGGLVVINDTFEVSPPPNVTSLEVREFFMGLPPPFPGYTDYHAFYRLYNGTWISLASTLSESEEGVRGFRVILPTPVTLGEGETLVLRGILLLSRVVRIYEQQMYAYFPLYPSLPLNISTCEVEIRLPRGAILIAVDPAVFSNSTQNLVYVLRHSRTSIPPLQKTVVNLLYQAGASSNTIVECEHLKRVMEVKPPSRVEIRDTYTLLNLGPTFHYYNPLIVKIHLNSSNARARDDLGLLSTNSLTKEGCIELHVRPRIPIRTGERWIFTVEYSLPLERCVEKGGGGNFLLNYVFLSNFSFTIRHLEVEVDLPEGGGYVTSTPTGEVSKTGPFRYAVHYAMENATILDDLGFQLAYRYNPLWMTFRPTLWASILVLVAIVAQQALRLRRPEERKIPEDRLLLREFVELYEEKLALSVELERLEEEIDSRRISRSEYNKRRRVIESRSSRVERRLRGVKGKIRQTMPQLEEVLREIEVAEVEIASEQGNLRELQARLRARRISRGAYRHLRREYLRRIRRARSRIERTVLSLRERVS
ncbi:hypothetical protein CW700_03355 [Candidatus Bathyarchaeota archaeon]|nr:MAG: hypothetical protein CW700_03355 [Candidatus Bathyarchaeota archaeon]